MKIIFLGAPGAGKGTQAERVSEKLGIPSISTGAIIREAVSSGTEMGRSAKEYMDAGKLLPDEVVIGMIKERLAQSDCQNGFILDGFPRTVPQAEALETMGVAIDRVIDIEVPDETIITRMSGRRVCPSSQCGASYHTVWKPSQDGSSCDRCGQPLTVRKDDMPEVVRDRLRVYHEQTEPLKAYYAAKGKLKTVIGQEEVAETTKLTFQALEN